MTSFLTDDNISEITEKVYEIFEDTPTGNGDPKLPDGMFAAGLLQAEQDLGLHGTEQEMRLIVKQLARWYPDQEKYESIFAKHGVERKDLREYLRLLTGRRNLFLSRESRRPNRRYENRHRKPRTPQAAGPVPFPSQGRGQNDTLEAKPKPEPRGFCPGPVSPGRKNPEPYHSQLSPEDLHIFQPRSQPESGRAEPVPDETVTSGS